jgi:hypothetical protein
VGIFGPEPARPLHRMTALRDEPAVAWLSPAERARVERMGTLTWALFWMCAFVVWLFIWRSLAFFFLYGMRLSFLIMAVVGLAVFRAVRRAILRARSERIEQLIRHNAAEVAADDWSKLSAEPDETVVSVVGWVRGRQRFDKPIGGEPAVGVALPCQHHYPGLFESLHDFDLVDEEGRTIFIQVAEGRLFGTPNLALDSHQLRLLYSDLGVPPGATPSSWHVHTLRDGDPVMVLGVKQTVADPAESGFRGPSGRLSLAASAPCPLVVFSIPAERRAI